MVEKRVRLNLGEYIGKAEVLVYVIAAFLLFVAALEAIGSSSALLWEGVVRRSMSPEAVYVLDELLLVLMIVEILHTVRLSIRAHVLVTEPFLIVGLIACIRRVLVITLQTAELTKNGQWTDQNARIFHASMTELSILGVLILILIVCVVLLRRLAPVPTSEITEPEKRSSST